LEALALMVTAKGCQQYIICKDSKDENTICVSEIWDTKADHDNSSKTAGSMELITKVVPLIDGKPGGTELEVIGGKGLP
jgi:quinol monooxygenase YgiN